MKKFLRTRKLEGGFLNFSILNPFSLAKVVSMNRPVAPLSSNTFTTIPSWLSNFSSPTLIQTSLSGQSVHCTSLTLSVILVIFDLLPSFSGHNTLYKLLEASQELTVLHFLLLTHAAFQLPFLCVFPNNFWPYGPTFHIHSTFYPLPFLCLHPLHLGLFLDPFELLLYWTCFLLLPLCILPPFSRLFVLPFLYMILLPLTAHFSLDIPHFSLTFFLLFCFASGFYLTSLLFSATLQWWLVVLLLLPTSF